MKLISASAVAAIIAAAVAPGIAAAQVAPGAAAAIAHFNQSKDAGDRIYPLAEDLNPVVVSTRTGSNAFVYDRLNADYDSANDIRGTEGATSYGNTPERAAAIFADIRAAQAEDE